MTETPAPGHALDGPVRLRRDTTQRRYAAECAACGHVSHGPSRHAAREAHQVHVMAAAADRRAQRRQEQ